MHANAHDAKVCMHAMLNLYAAIFSNFFGMQILVAEVCCNDNDIIMNAADARDRVS